MKYKKIIKPDINPLILNTFVVDWNFRPSKQGERRADLTIKYRDLRSVSFYSKRIL